MAVSIAFTKKFLSKFQCTSDPCPPRQCSPSFLGKLFNIQ